MFKRFSGRFALMVVVVLIAGMSLTACGGGSSTLAQQEKEQAEEHGREEAQERAKEKRLELKLSKLERENGQAKKRHREKERRELKERNEGVTPPPSTESTPPPSSEGTDCGGGTIAGPETSCGFAINTRAEYEAYVGSGSGSVEAWSEANSQYYDMYCTEGARHECSGAISATVYWP